jgi:hypothetical protein
MQAIKSTLSQATAASRRQSLLLEVKHEELKKEMGTKLGRLEDENRALQHQLETKFEGLEKQNEELKELLLQALAKGI